MEEKLIKFLLFFVLLISVVHAKEIDLSSKNYILYNLNESEIIDSKDEHSRVSVASLTKIMTVIVAIENIDNFDDKVTISDDMISNIEHDVVKVGFKKGEVVTYNDLLYGAILRSGADAVNALAISTAGDMNSFIKKMNDKVKELGLKDTHFSNAVGLYDKDNYSSAYDMAQILIYSLGNIKFKSVFTTKEYTLTNNIKVTRTVEAYNRKLKRDLSFIKGSKTGFVEEAGYCLASIATLNNVNYLFISLGADKSPNQILDHIKEYTYFKDNYAYHDLITTDYKITTLNTKYAYEKNIDIYYHKNIKKYLKNDFDSSQVEVTYTGKDTITYFTPKNSKLGSIEIKYKDEVIDSYDVFNNTKLTLNIHDLFLEYEDYLVYIILLVCFIIIFIKYVNNRCHSNLKVDNKRLKF